jgi:sulfotransferase 6B1
MRSDESRRAALMRIVEYLWQGLTPPVSYKEMVRLMESNINPQNSVTFRKEKIGSWREEFDD